MTDLLSTTAISWGFSAASWLISPVLIRLLNKCFDALGIDPQFQSRQQILLDKLEKLETTLLPKLLILADAAQQSNHRQILQKWLKKLKSAFYEAEHVLGLIEHKRLEKEVNSLFPSTSKCSFKKLIVKLPKFSSEKKYLIKSLENLEKIVNEGMEFVALLNLPSSSGNTLTQSSNEQYRKTISAPGSTVIGREKDRDYIVKLLREDIPESSSNVKCYSVIGIWGMGWLGKTTLAQYVCDHEKEEKYFDRVMWAHVSQNFSVDAIWRNIWESGFKEKCPKFNSLEGLQSALQEKLKGERYFMVLDDVWCDKGVSEGILLPLLSLCYQLHFLSLYYQSKVSIPNVGRLISLHEQTDFRVRMERGFEIKQLEHLKDIYGTLSISGLNNVKSKEEADRAKLSDKKGLCKLSFEWDYESGDVLRDNNVEILDGLCPPPQIKDLTIIKYSGKRFPSWILENNDNVIHLQHLQLFGCDGLEALHRINELSDLLYLGISFLTRLKSWVPLPLNLTKLVIHNCPPLVFAMKEDLDMIMSTKGIRISRIVTFKEMMNDDNVEDFLFSYDFLSIDYQFNEILGMMKYGDDNEEETLSTISKDLNKWLEKKLDLICQLKNVYGEPFLPPALESLHIESCFITDKILAGSLQGLTSLTHLTLGAIITITCIPKEVLSSQTNLLNLQIGGCMLLTSIGGLDTHSTLEELEIHFCPNLTTFETSLIVASCSDTIELISSSCRRKTISNTLKWVKLEGCMLSDDMLHGLISPERLNVSGIPTMVNPHIGHFKALISVLELNNCPNLVSLRGLNELTNLERLKVEYGCDKLECYSYADKLPQLKELCIYRFSLLERLVSIDGFSSLVSLILYGAQQEYFSQEICDEIFPYLTSLTKIEFVNCKMRPLPNLMCLHSLRDISISFCRELSSLPEVPPSVQRIYIRCCNEEFTRSCKDSNHPNWHKISHISDKDIRQY